MTPAQQAMLCQSAADPEQSADREDDWTAFGLYREGNQLHGPVEALERYVAYRREKLGLKDDDP